jgi:hypothetical protein
VRTSPRLTGRQGRRAAHAALRLLALAAFVAALAPGVARAQRAEVEREEALPGSGIRYPLGYDAETEGTLEGRVLRVELPERGPVVVRIESGGRPAAILTAPAWFWERSEWQPAVGDRVQVFGSKTLGADGELYVVAREILPVGPGCGCSVRDEQGRPLWRGRMHERPARRCRQPEPGTGPPGP